MPDPGDASSLYIGLMSGTSMDGIDAALFRLGDRSCETVATKNVAYPSELRDALLFASRDPGKTTVDTIGDLDHRVGICFRDATTLLLDSSGTDASTVMAIGSHGQTLRHRPDIERPFTLQIGDPNIIANGTGVTTVADFRRRDLAAGGEGAPLAPAFHQWLFADNQQQRVVLNIGGIANITVLPGNGDRISGFDTGPGNGLMDAWIQQQQDKSFDDNGAWAASGRVLPDLLAKMLEDPYFQQRPPKSTGFEHFNSAWLDLFIGDHKFHAADIQATLLALSSVSITNAIGNYAANTQVVLICGGGVHNAAFVTCLADQLPGMELKSTREYGLDPDWVEAAAFAWLAKQTLSGLPGNLPSVTGASTREILGGIYMCGT